MSGLKFLCKKQEKISFKYHFELYICYLRILTSLSLKTLKFSFKKQPDQKINASLKKQNQKLNQSNGTTYNSTTIPICEKNCTKGITLKVVSA